MIILPYYITEKSLPIGCTLWTLWIFMAGSGKTLWKTDDEDTTAIIREYLTENGIFGLQMQMQQQMQQQPSFLLYKVDTTKTQLNDFHRWSDVLGSTNSQDADSKDADSPEHVWRPFFWLGNRLGQADSWGWKEEVSGLKLDQFHTMGQIWEMVSPLASEQEKTPV